MLQLLKKTERKAYEKRKKRSCPATKRKEQGRK